MQNVLKAWSELGAQDPEKLKALLVERRMKTFQGLLLQTVLDFVACGGKNMLNSSHCNRLQTKQLLQPIDRQTTPPQLAPAPPWLWTGCHSTLCPQSSACW